MKVFRNKFFIVFLCVFITMSSVMESEARADAFTATLATTTAAAGGAFGWVPPVLLACAVIYAGYEIYQHREQIQDAFNDWFVKDSDSTVENWVNDTVTKVETREITDLSTIKVPANVLNKSAQFVDDYATHYKEMISTNVNVTSTTTVFLNSLAPYAQTQVMKNWLTNSAIITYAPVIIFRNMSTKTETIQYLSSQYASKNVMTLFNTSKIYFNYDTAENFLNKLSVPNTGSGSPVLPYGNQVSTTGTYDALTDNWSSVTSVNQTNYNQTGMNGSSYVIENGKINTGQYIITVVLPKNGYLSISGYDGLDNGKIIPELSDVMAGTGASTIDNPLVKKSDRVYTPSYETDVDGTEYLPLVLNPDVVQGINDYVNTKTIDAIDVVREVDPEGIQELTDTNKDILDVITDLPGTILDALKGALQWLFVPDQSKVQEFVTEAEAKWEGNTNIFTYPIELVIRFLTEVYTLQKADCIIRFPRIEYKGYVLFAGVDFNFTDYVEQSQFDNIYGYYIIITDFIMIIAVLNLAIKKGDEIIRGN